jgi:8-hydroxy-5-deazaflavin:NADPH oxidoreductase
VLMAGDDADAKARVADVATSLGFAPVDAGGQRLARALEEMAFLNITLNATNGWAWQSAWQLVGPTA